MTKFAALTRFRPGVGCARRLAKQVASALLSAKVRTLLVLLLVGDLVLILLHLANREVRLSDKLFLDVDWSYGEFLQYFKFTWMIVLSLWAGLMTRRGRLAAWSVIFGYLLLDDALQLHERLGRFLTDLRYGDVHQPNASMGELVGLAVPLLLCATLAWFLQQERRTSDRTAHHVVIAVLGAMAFFGVAVDALHGMISYSAQPGDLMAIIEDGGEHISASALVALLSGWIATAEKPGGAAARGTDGQVTLSDASPAGPDPALVDRRSH